MEDRRLLRGGEAPPSFDDQRVLEEDDLEVLLVNPREIHHDLHRARGLVRVGVGVPAVFREQAHPIRLPEIVERTGPARTHDHRVAITEASVTHGPPHHPPADRGCPVAGRATIRPSP